MNMKKWMKEQLASPIKKPIPVLSFPSATLLGVSVRELISSSDLQSRGMSAIAERCPSAASLSMMDLSVEAEAFGSEVITSEGEVPTVLGKLVEDYEAAEALKIPKVGEGRTGLYIETIAKAKELITSRPVLAGVIGPYSLAGRLLDVSEAMIYCYEEPELVHLVMEKTTEFLINYLNAYKAAGADGVVMAEPLTGMLSPALAEEFSAPYTKRIADCFKDDENFLFVYHNCGNNTVQMLDTLLSIGADAYHFGNAVDIEAILKKAPSDVPILGNISPVSEFRGGTPESMRRAVLSLLERCSVYPNFIISSGCDIPPLSPWENIDAFFSAVDEFYSGRK